MKVESKAEVTYKVTLEYTEEEAYKLRRAVDFLQRMLPARDDGLDILMSMFTPRPGSGTYQDEFEVGPMNLGG